MNRTCSAFIARDRINNIFMIGRDFFWVWNIISWFIKITLNRFTASCVFILCRFLCYRINQHTWWNLFALYFISIFKHMHYVCFRQLFFKTFFQTFIFWLKQTFSKNWQIRIVQPTRLEKIQKKFCFSAARLSNNQTIQASRQKRMLAFICCVMIPT